MPRKCLNCGAEKDRPNDNYCGTCYNLLWIDGQRAIEQRRYLFMSEYTCKNCGKPIHTTAQFNLDSADNGVSKLTYQLKKHTDACIVEAKI